MGCWGRKKYVSVIWIPRQWDLAPCEVLQWMARWLDNYLYVTPCGIGLGNAGQPQTTRTLSTPILRSASCGFATTTSGNSKNDLRRIILGRLRTMEFDMSVRRVDEDIGKHFHGTQQPLCVDRFIEYSSNQRREPSSQP